MFKLFLYLLSPEHDLRRSITYINEIIDSELFNGDLSQFEVKTTVVVNYN